ncbi:unnamed protein product [Trichobilharzia regenti]|nr:unnamed protein product [Trichobilharzia regenti]
MKTLLQTRHVLQFINLEPNVQEEEKHKFISNDSATREQHKQEEIKHKPKDVDTTTVTAEDTTPDIGTSNTTDTADDAITNIGASNTTLTIDDTITTTSSIETDEIYANDTVPDINKEIIKNFSMKLYPLENFTTPRNIRVRIENTDCSGDESAICGKEVTCKVNRMDGKNFKLPVTAYSSNSLILPHTTCSCEEGNAYGVEVYHEEKRDVYMKCYENNPCEQCDSQHTLQCIINDDNSATCVCETGYSEFENCKEVKNGCDKPHPAATLSGNEACLVNNSNVCQPKFDSYEYTCMCKEPYREDRRLSFPNCMINTTYCKSMICVGFQPPVSALIPGPVVYVNIDDYDVIEADDCRNTTCYCPDGWVGQHCTEPRGDIVQLSWSPWSACNPDCIMPNRRWNYKYGEEIHAGESRTTGLGYMSKYARCNHNDSRYCQGTYRMWKRCTVTNLCDIETESRISTVIAKAIGKAMEKHDEVG